MNLTMLLEMVAEAAPDRAVVGTRQQQLTAAELLGRVDQAATRIGATDAEHVAWVGLNSDAYPVALLAAAKAGKPFAPVNYRLPDEQLVSVLRRLVPCVVVAGPEVAARIGDVDGLEIWSESDLTGPTGSASDEAPDEVGFRLKGASGISTGDPKAYEIVTFVFAVQDAPVSVTAMLPSAASLLVRATVGVVTVIETVELVAVQFW